VNQADRETLSYAVSILRKALPLIDPLEVEYAEVGTAIHYLDHIVEGRAANLGQAARVEHERYVASLSEKSA
jgi:hypothetical protein